MGVVNMLDIREVKTRKEKRDFLDFPLKLYKDNKYFVPPLYSDERKIFHKNYMYYDQSEAKYWIIYENGEVVGRISAILQKAANEKWRQKRVRFTRFDCIDNQEVANALFKCVEDYAKEKGMEEVVGPLGFSDLEREGLLIEGFDYLSTFEEQYNYPYYQKLLENYGYDKDVDWVEHRMIPSKESVAQISALSDRVLAKGQIHLVKIKSLKSFIKKYRDKFFDILDKTYDHIYGTVPFTDGMKKLLIENYAPVINTNYIKCVVDKDDNIIAFGICFPAMGEIFQKTGGKLKLRTIFELLHNVKHPKRIDLGLVGVLDDAKYTGAAAVVYGEYAKQLTKDNIEYMETNLNLEDNLDIISTWSHFNPKQHKRRRCFFKKI